jgi:hypothetical protein
MNEKTKLPTDVTSAGSPICESAWRLASVTGPRTSTTAETRRLESRRYTTPTLPFFSPFHSSRKVFERFSETRPIALSYNVTAKKRTSETTTQCNSATR